MNGLVCLLAFIFFIINKKQVKMIEIASTAFCSSNSIFLLAFFFIFIHAAPHRVCTKPIAIIIGLTIM